MSERLPNYLRSHRKKAGLSQAEVAHLIGVCSGSRVSRYERFMSHPKLETVLAYELVFGTQVRFLFAGVHAKVEASVFKRARILSARMAKQEPTGVSALKTTALARILDAHDETTRSGARART